MAALTHTHSFLLYPSKQHTQTSTHTHTHTQTHTHTTHTKTHTHTQTHTHTHTTTHTHTHFACKAQKLQFTTQPRLHSDGLQLPHIVLTFIGLGPLLHEYLFGELVLSFGLAHGRLFEDGHRRFFVNLLAR